MEYAPPFRITDLELHSKVKIQAAKERKTMIEVVEKALKDYLKNPPYRS